MEPGGVTESPKKESPPPATLEVRIPKESKFKANIGGVEAEQGITIIGTGKVKSFSDNECNKNFTIELEEIKIKKDLSDLPMDEYRSARKK